MGGSVNADQWLVGGYLRTSLPCLGDLGLGPLLVFGVGGNHFTVRSAGRLDYMLWLDGDHDFGLYPTVGASVLFYAPIGPFATFCDRVDLDECSGHLLGGEVGGGVRFRSFVVDAVVGFGGLPVLTILGAFALPVDGSGAP